MNDSLLASQAEVKVLEYKLNKIKSIIENRIKIVDPIVKNELEIILNMIEEYETVPTGWNLEKSFVLIPEQEDETNV